MSHSANAGELAIALDADQGNLLISALAECPFKLVYELIGKLNEQVNAQDRRAAPVATYVCHLQPAEVKLCLTALSKLPYHQVYALIDLVHQQLATASQPLTAKGRLRTRGTGA